LKIAELDRLENVVVQQFWSMTMASEHSSDKPAVTERKPPRDRRSPAPTSPKGGSPPLGEGLEPVRSGDC
jgi:hypothetical protein